MLTNNRRPYMGRSAPERTQDAAVAQSIPQNIDVESLKRLIVDSLKQLNRNMEELDKKCKVLEEKMEYIDARLIKTEDRLNKYDSSYSTTRNDLFSIRSELDSMRKNRDSSYSYYDEETDNMPVMPGTGFSSITPEYLRNLAKNRNP